MKRFLLTFLLVLMIPLSASAISLDELQSNPDKYTKIYEAENGTMYIDSESIKSIRYAPPYYTLQVKDYYVLYNLNCIQQSISTYNYDYNKNCATLTKKYAALYPSYSSKQIIDLVLAESKKDSGVIVTSVDINCYEFDGTFITTGKPIYSQEVPFWTNLCYSADSVFKKYYGISFTTGMK